MKKTCLVKLLFSFLFIALIAHSKLTYVPLEGSSDGTMIKITRYRRKKYLKLLFLRFPWKKMEICWLLLPSLKKKAMFIIIDSAKQETLTNRLKSSNQAILMKPLQSLENLFYKGTKMGISKLVNTLGDSMLPSYLLKEI